MASSAAKLVSAGRLNRFWKNGVLAKMVAKTRVLKSMTEITANTSAENIAGALAVKELNSKLVSNLKVNDKGQLVMTKGGADTVLPFSSKVLSVQGYVFKGVSGGKSEDYLIVPTLGYSKIKVKMVGGGYTYAYTCTYDKNGTFTNEEASTKNEGNKDDSGFFVVDVPSNCNCLKFKTNFGIAFTAYWIYLS